MLVTCFKILPVLIKHLIWDYQYNFEERQNGSICLLKVAYKIYLIRTIKAYKKENAPNKVIRLKSLFIVTIKIIIINCTKLYT